MIRLKIKYKNLIKEFILNKLFFKLKKSLNKKKTFVLLIIYINFFLFLLIQIKNIIFCILYIKRFLF